MKTLKITLLAFVGLFLASCGSDSTADLLPGIWNVTTLEYSECLDPNDNEVENLGSDACETVAGVVNCDLGVWDFMENGTVNIEYSSTEDGTVVWSDTDSGTYSIQEDDSRVQICVDGDCFTGTIVISESTMTWAISMEGCTLTFGFTK